MKVKSETEDKDATEIKSEIAQFLSLIFFNFYVLGLTLNKNLMWVKMYTNFFNGFENLVKFWVGVHRMQNYNLCKTILGLSSKT